MKKLFINAAIIAASLCSSVAAYAQTETKYVKVETEPESWTGEYLIVYEADDENSIAYAFNGALTDLDVVNNFIEVSNTKQVVGETEVRAINSSAEADAATFTVTPSTETAGKYYIQSASGFWIGYNSTKAGEDGINPDPDLKSSDTKQYDNAIALEVGKTSVVVTSVNGFELRFNADAGKSRFRYHMSGKKKSIKFYKKTEVATAINELKADVTTNVAYDLQGRRVANTQHGIVIIDGKKVVK